MTTEKERYISELDENGLLRTGKQVPIYPYVKRSLLSAHLNEEIEIYSFTPVLDDNMPYWFIDGIEPKTQKLIYMTTYSPKVAYQLQLYEDMKMYPLIVKVGEVDMELTLLPLRLS